MESPLKPAITVMARTANSTLPAAHIVKRWQLNGLTAALLATLLWGTGNVAQKLALSDFTVTQLFYLRGSLGFVVVLPFAILEWRRRGLRLEILRKNAFWLLVYVASFLSALLLQIFAAENSSATMLGFLINLCVVFTPFILWLHGSTLLQLPVLFGCVVTIVGVGLLTGGQFNGWGPGESLSVLAAVAYSYWIIATGKVASGLCAPFVLTALMMAPFPAAALAMGDGALLMQHAAQSENLGALLYLGLGTTGLSFLLAAMAQRHLNPVLAGLIYSLEALVGAITAQIVLGESLTALAWLGGGLMLTGIVLSQWPEASPEGHSLEH